MTIQVLEAWNGLDDLRPSLERFLRGRCRDLHQVEDVVQESLMRAARYRRGQSEPGRLRSWLLRISVNVLADDVRRERRRRLASGGALEELVADGPSLEELVEGDSEVWLQGCWWPRQRVFEALRAALDALPSEERGLLEQYYDGGSSGRELARQRSVTPELVKVRLFRARARLRKRLLGALLPGAAPFAGSASGAECVSGAAAGAARRAR